MDALRIILILTGAAIVLGIYFYSRHTTRQAGNPPRRHAHRQSDKNTQVSGVRHRIATLLASLHFPLRKKPQTQPARNPDVHSEQLDVDALDSLGGIVAEKFDISSVSLFDETDNGNKPDDGIGFKLHTHDQQEAVAHATEDYLLVLNIKSRKGEAFTGESILNATKQAGMQYGQHGIFHRHAIIHDRVVKQPVCSLANMFEPGTFDLNHIDQIETTGLVMFMQLPGPVTAEAAFENTIRTAQKLALELDAKLCDDSHSILTAQTIGHLKEQMKAYDFRQRINANRQHH